MPKWVLHGDPAFKNFLFNNAWGIVGLIDYEKIEYNCILWDLADQIRSYLKVDWFHKRELQLLLKAYQDIRLLTDNELDALPSYLTMMILNTCTQYLLGLFEKSDFSNNIGSRSDSLSKIERCFNEIEKVKLLF